MKKERKSDVDLNLRKGDPWKPTHNSKNCMIWELRQWIYIEIQI